MSKINDDSIIDFDLLDSLLDEKDVDEKEKTVSCPKVIRNQKPWRYPEVMGKWTHPLEEIPDK